MSQTRRLQFLAGRRRAFGGIALRKSSNRDQEWLLPHHKAKYHVEYMLYISLYFTGEQNWPNIVRWNGSFLLSRRQSIFVVHEIQLRPRCIMESVNGSLITVSTCPAAGCSLEKACLTDNTPFKRRKLMRKL